MVSRIEALAMPSYPHFKPIETKLAKLFLRKFVIDGEYHFDFRLPIEIPKRWLEYPEPVREMLISLKQRRIDILIETSDRDYIVELEPRLSARGIGQLLTYQRIYTTKVKLGRKTVLIDACLEADEDTKKIAESFGIRVFLLK